MTLSAKGRGPITSPLGEVGGLGPPGEGTRTEIEIHDPLILSAPFGADILLPKGEGNSSGASRQLSAILAD